MARRRILNTPMPAALACALFEDGGRVLFLEQSDERGQARWELPAVLVAEGADAVGILRAYLHESLSLDVQVHPAVLRGHHNAGSRRRPRPIRALGFACTAKKVQPKLPDGYRARWLRMEEALGGRLGRTAEWLRSAMRI